MSVLIGAYVRAVTGPMAAGAVGLEDESVVIGEPLIIRADGIVRVHEQRIFAEVAGAGPTVFDVTIRGVKLIGRTLATLGAARCRWLLDRPVSNSGRLATILRETASRQGWPWSVELVPDPDPILAASDSVVVTADSMILDGCSRWTNLTRAILGDVKSKRESVPMGVEWP